MLCKTIHKVAMATALWAMALLGASLANAQIYFDPDPDAEPPQKTGTLTFSAEGLVSLEGRTTTTGADQGFYAINSATSSLMEVYKDLPQLTVYRLGQATDNVVWLRVEGDGSVLKLFAEPILVVTGGVFAEVRAETGLSGNGVYIYEIEPGASGVGAGFPTAFNSADPPRVRVNLGTIRGGADFSLAVASTRIKHGTGMLTVSGYETGPGAFTGGSDGRLFTDTVAVTRTASSIGVAFSEGTTATSDVETGFTKFVGASPNSATLGSVTVGLAATATNHLLPNGEKVLASNVGTLLGADSMIQVQSDMGFGFANFRLGGAALTPVATATGMLHEDATCSDPNPDMGTNAMENVCAVGLSAGAKALTVGVITPTEENPAQPIPASTFMATVMFDDDDNAVKSVLPANAGPRKIGEIVQNGATYQLPMVTTFEGYNNRIIIVNRGTRDASYSMTFTTEDGVNATAASAATGTVGMKSAEVVRVMDAVALEGGMRAAATLFVVGAPGNIDVLTQIVNKSDGSTDTLRYDAEQSR